MSADRPATVTPGDVEEAAAAIAPLARRTPMLEAGELTRRFGAPIALKAECLQRTGSFKIRGAANAVSRLDRDALERGVCAASAGNHAQAVTVAAAQRGARAELFMPDSAPLAKVAAVRDHGGTVRLVEGGYDEAQAAAAEHARTTGMTFIHAFDDPVVVAGQGTVGIEIAEQAPETRLVVVPLGGGGLAAGTAIAAGSRLPGLRVVGVQSEACAPYPPSLAAHRPLGARSTSTICDGIAVKHPGELTLPLVAEHVDEVVTVSDDEVAQAMVLFWSAPSWSSRAPARRAWPPSSPARSRRRPRGAPARSSPAATSTPRAWRSASALARPPPAGAWCSSPSCPTGREPSPRSFAAWPRRARTSST